MNKSGDLIDKKIIDKSHYPAKYLKYLNILLLFVLKNIYRQTTICWPARSPVPLMKHASRRAVKTQRIVADSYISAIY